MDTKTKSFFNFLRLGDVASASLCARGHEKPLCLSHDPVTGETPLVAVIVGLVEGPVSLCEAFVTTAVWLVEHGADPHQVTSGGNDHATSSRTRLTRDFTRREEERQSIEFSFVQNSALSLIAQLQSQFHRLTTSAWDLFAQSLESMRVVLQKASSPTWTEDGMTIDMAAPVDEVMLKRGRVQSASKRFRVDCATDAITFLSDFCYTGTTSQAHHIGMGLPALDLAQYWQVHRAAKGLESAACGELPETTFDDIADAAFLKGSEVLVADCGRLAAGPDGNDLLKSIALPTAATPWLSDLDHPGPPAKRPRFSFNVSSPV
mmetsp:Transcript_59799/g.110686  ORF Transcript_59799/g.110686 Transcript_59799/m.110686 type:complete len:319 (-) Transcript_59799:67-1023(-)